MPIVKEIWVQALAEFSCPVAEARPSQCLFVSLIIKIINLSIMKQKNAEKEFVTDRAGEGCQKWDPHNLHRFTELDMFLKQ